MDQGDIDQGFAVSGAPFVILTHATIAPEPEGALHDPAIGQLDEARLAIAVLDDIQDATQERQGPLDQVPGLGPIGPHLVSSRGSTPASAPAPTRPQCDPGSWPHAPPLRAPVPACP